MAATRSGFTLGCCARQTVTSFQDFFENALFHGNSELETYVKAGDLDSSIATTLLHHAAQTKGSEDVLATLLARGDMDVNAMIDRSCALQRAAQADLPKQCRILLKNGADVNLVETKSASPECRRIIDIWS